MDDTTPQWRKSTRSTAQGSCVELGNGKSGVLVRDTKQSHMNDRERTTVPFNAKTWAAFTADLKG